MASTGPGSRARLLAVRLAVAAALLAAAACERAAPPRPRNLVLISIDTLTPARTSAYGAERDTTPALRALAARGVRFDEAFTTSPWTLPAHAALLTGRYPSSLAPDPNDGRLLHAAPPLAELFRTAGARTAAFTGTAFVSGRYGFDRGFETFASGPAAAVAAWLEQHRDEPFFLFFHTYLVHAPYRDHRFVEGLPGGRLEAYRQDERRRRFLGLALAYGRFVPTPEERAYLLALYDGGVARADEQVATIWAALERLGLTASTAVVVVSDHGEEFWQHTGRAAYHGHTLYDELLRVPLVWYEPGLPEPGRTVDQPVSLVDVVPTVVARFGLAPPERLDGLDLSPLLDGGRWEVDRPLFAEGVRHGPARASVRTRQGKLIAALDDVQHGEAKHAPLNVAPVELFLPGDRDERFEASAQEPELVRTLEALLAEHRGRAAQAPPPAELEPLTPKLRRQLRALGYAED